MASPALNSPVPTEKMHQIATDACNTVFSTTKAYEHSRTTTWNTTIINAILHALIRETSTPEGSSPQYKFIVTSTIIQHSPPSASFKPTTSSTSTSTATETLKDEPSSEHKPAPAEPTKSEAGNVGKRGMHSATGAYWNSEKDGMWSFKWDGKEEGERGFDVVVSVVWVGV